MRILIAPYPFKGTLTSREAAEAIAGALTHDTLDLLPLGDGGAGTLDALAENLHTATCLDATRNRRRCRWGTTHDGDAVIEAAEVIALADVDRDHRHPATLSSEGLGALILEAISTRPRRMIVGLGDTATHDCGLGIGAALGYRFLDANGNLLEPVGASLMALASIDRGGARGLDRPITVYCDVLNPLLGEDGAARRFASQKGALPEEVESLERGGERFAMIVERDLGVRVADVPGAGAAGGLGAGLVAFAGASLTGGADAVLDAVRFDERAAACDLVISGEGRLDAKTMLGKGVGNVARCVRRIGARMLVIAGSLEGERREWERKLGAHVALLDDAGPTAAASLARAVLAGMRDERDEG